MFHSGNVIIPVGIWSDKPPEHRITSILVLPSASGIVTGCDEGSMIIWSLQNNDMKPKWMLHGLTSAVRNLVHAGFVNNDHHFVVHSSNNELALINSADGTCVEMRVDLKNKHNKIKSHRPSYLDYNLLFCCGSYPYIVIMHAISLTNLFQLSYQSQPNWISAFTVFTHTSKSQEVVLGISTAGVATVWTLNGKEIQNEIKFEHESKVIDCPHKVIALYCCPRTPRLVLLITSSGWKVLDAMGCNILESYPNPSKDALINGDFLSPNTIIVYGKSGRGYLYQITERVREKATPQINESVSFLIAQISFDSFETSKSYSILNSCGLNLFSLLPPTNRENPSDVRIIGTNFHLPGTLFIWSLPISILKTGSQIVTKELSSIDPVAMQSLESIWNITKPPDKPRDNPTVSILVHSSSRSTAEESFLGKTSNSSNESSDNRLTPSLHAAIPPRIVVGTESGDIIVCRFTEALSHLLWIPNSTHEKSQPICAFSQFRLRGHKKPITALCHPMSVQWERSLLNSQSRNMNDFSKNGATFIGLTEQNTVNRLANTYQYDPGLLLSASEDWTVRLWELNMGLDEAREKKANPCLRIFSSFISPVISFVIGPPVSLTLGPTASNPQLSCCVCAVTLNGGVSVLNLRERSTLLKCIHKVDCPVLTIGWRVPEALICIYRQDGSLSVWEVTSGTLERLEVGNQACDIFEQSEFRTQIRHSLPTPQGSIGFDSPEYPWAHHSENENAVSGNGNNNNNQLMTSVPSAECSSSSGPTSHISRAQLRRKRRLRVCPDVRQNISPIGFYQIGTCLKSSDSSKSIFSCHEQPALRVLIWDIESLIVDLLVEAGMLDNLRENKELFANAHAVTSSCRILCLNGYYLRMFLRLIHSWGLDDRLDELLQSRLRISSPLRCSKSSKKYLDPNISFGFISNHGFITMSMPGFNGKWVVEEGTSAQQHLRLYFMSPLLTSNMSLAAVAICETLTSFSPETIPLILGVSPEEQENDKDQDNSVSKSSELGSVFELLDSIPPETLKDTVLQLKEKSKSLKVSEAPFAEAQAAIIFAFHLCTRQLRWLNAGGPKDPCPVVLYQLLIKWQDPCLSIRYAARSLLCSILDNINTDGRNSLIKWWLGQVPPMILSNGSQTSQPRPVLTDTNVSQNHVKHTSLIRATSKAYDSQVSTVSAKITNASLMMNANSSAVSVDYADVRKVTPTLPLQAETGIGSGDVEDMLSFSQLNTNMDKVGIIQNCAWWFSLRGYGQSERGQLLNHSTAIVLLSFIYSRYTNANYRSLDTLVYVRDHVEKVTTSANLSNNPSVSSNLGALRLNGLSEPHFSALNSDFKDNATLTVLDHSIGRFLCDCLLKLLSNQCPRLTPQDVGLNEQDLESLNANSDHLNPAWVMMSALNNANNLARQLWAIRGADGTIGCCTLRRIALDIIGRGFFVWEPYLDVAKLLMIILIISADADASIKNLYPGETLSDYCDLKRTARQALWSIGFAQPQLVTLTLSREIRGFGGVIQSSNVPAQGNQWTSAAVSNPITSEVPPINHLSISTGSSAGTLPMSAPPNQESRNLQSSSTNDSSQTLVGQNNPLFVGRMEILLLMEQLCLRRPADMVQVLPELLEVCIACADRTRIKERGLIHVCPALNNYSAISSNIKTQKACAGSANGSLVFFDFKVGRYFTISEHKGPISAVKFSTDGRSLASYSIKEDHIRIWQISNTGFFGIGSQQVKMSGTYRVQPLTRPPGPGSNSSTANQLSGINEIWLDWTEPKVVQLITHSGVTRKINIG